MVKRTFYYYYFFLYLSDYPWRTAVHPLTSNVIKWFYLPDFAMRPNPLFIFCEYIFEREMEADQQVKG